MFRHVCYFIMCNQSNQEYFAFLAVPTESTLEEPEDIPKSDW